MRRAILVAMVLTSLWSEQATAIDGNKLFEHCEFFSTARLPHWTLVRVVTVSATFRAFTTLYSPPASFVCLMG